MKATLKRIVDHTALQEHLPAELTVKHTETQRVAMKLGTNFKANHKAITAKGPAKPALFFLAQGFPLYWLAPMAPHPRFSLCPRPPLASGKPLNAPPKPHARRPSAERPATRWAQKQSIEFEIIVILLVHLSLQKWRLYRKRLLRGQRPPRGLRLPRFFREPLSHHPRFTRAKRFGPARFLSGDGRRFS
jgi:hypothetical protein